MDYDARPWNVSDLKNQSTPFWFVGSLTKMAEAEGSFEERFSETVRQFPGPFSVDTKSLRLFLRMFLRR